MNQRELAHLWAQNNGTSRTCGSMFYERETLYSYGHHFILAKYIADNVILYNSGSYSSTTAKHQSYTRGAIDYHSNTVFTVPFCDIGHNKTDDRKYHGFNLVHFADEIKKNLQSATRARTYRDYYLAMAQDLINDAKAYIEYFKCKGLLKAEAKRLIFELSADDLARVGTDISEKAKTAKVRRIAKNKRDTKKILKEWRAGNSNSLPWHLHIDGDLLRVGADGLIQTSKGISIDMNEGKRMYGVIKAVRNQGEGWNANGQQIMVKDHNKVEYQMDWIKSNGDMKAGCHEIKWTELERFAKSQDWI